MNNKVIRIAIITNIITIYRQGFFDRLFARNDFFIKVYCQDSIPGMNLTSIHERYPDNVKIIKSISAMKEEMVWKFIPWREIVNGFDVIFVAGSPRDLSDAVFATYLRLTGKNVILWTMAHSYRGNKLTENIRLYWSRIFSYLFVYNDKEVDFLHQKGFKNKYILGMNNGLDQNKIDKVILLWTKSNLEQWLAVKYFNNRTIILSSARLDPKNRFELVLKALPKIIDEIPNVLWCLIGDGVEKQKLQSMAESIGLNGYVHFVGSLYDEFELAPYFLSAELFIHPASIGLSIMHAFGYGLPLVTHGNASMHGPDYAAFIPEYTGRNFIENDINSLSEVIIGLIKDTSARQKMRQNVQKLVREKYNVDIMANRFFEMAKEVYNDSIV